MPGPLIQIGATLMCPHGGQITITPSGPSPTIDGMPVATIAAVGVVAGCANIGPNLKPCTTVTWTAGTTQVTMNGVPALLPTSPAVFDCIPPVAGAPAIVVPPTVQPHAMAT
jgi:hypothetical protein